MSISRRTFLKTSLAAGVVLSASVSPAGDLLAKSKKKYPKAKRVLIITFDGIRVDGFKQARTPNLDALIASGSVSWETRDVMPSVTLPNYTSHLSGAGPEVHGVSDNSWKHDSFLLPPVETDEDGYFPSVFKVLKDNVPGIRNAFFYNWKPLISPHNPKAIDVDSFAQNAEFVQLYEQAFDFISENRDIPTFTFLYSVHTDKAGHKYEWMSPQYISAIEEGDVEVGKLIAKLKAAGLYDDTHIIFMSDHGGIGKHHGGVSREEMIVPWAVEGPGIKKGFTITEANNTVNTASTVLRLFGVEQPLCWTGEVPESIFAGK